LVDKFADALQQEGTADELQKYKNELLDEVQSAAKAIVVRGISIEAIRKQEEFDRNITAAHEQLRASLELLANNGRNSEVTDIVQAAGIQAILLYNKVPFSYADANGVKQGMNILKEADALQALVIENSDEQHVNAFEKIYKNQKATAMRRMVLAMQPASVKSSEHKAALEVLGFTESDIDMYFDYVNPESEWLLKR
jgi:hypothetical protein